MARGPRPASPLTGQPGGPPGSRSRRAPGPWPGRRLGGAALATALFAALLAACSGSDSGSSSGANVAKVSVFEVAQADVVTQLEKAFTAELTADLGADRVKVNVVNANGDASLIQSIARNLSRSDDDLIAVIGTPAVIAMAQQDSTHPIIAIAMGDPVGSKVADSLDAPGHNVTGTIDYIDPGQLLDQLATVRPAPHRIGTLYDPSNENSQTWIAGLKKAIAGRDGLSLRETTVASAGDVQSAARSLVGRVDTILVGPDAAVASGVAALGTVAFDNRIPLYLTSGDASVHGVLATLGPDYPGLGTSAAKIGAQVLAGKKPATIPFGRPGDLQWDVNHATVSQVRVTLPASAS
jgi:putative ABC transport system substrate-binding protein